MFRRLDGKGERAGDQAGVDQEERHRFGEGRGLHHDGVELIDAAHDLRKLAEYGLQLFNSGVQGGGVFEFKTGRCLVALRRDFPHQRVSAAVEIGLHPANLSPVIVVGAAFEARREAHFHFGIDAAGKVRVGMEVVDAASHLEEIQRIVGELFCRGARGERTIVKRAPARAAEPGGNRGARVFIFHMQLEQRGKTEAQAVRVSFRESRAKLSIQEKTGFEIGARGSELDGAHAVAQVQSAGLFRRAEEALQAAAQVGGLADVGLGLGIVAAQEEDGGRGWSGGENFRIAIGSEIQALGQHEAILV